DEMSLIRAPIRARNSVELSHLRCEVPCALRVLMVSNPDSDSTKPALRWALAWNDSVTKCSIRACATNDTINTTTIAITGGMIIQGETQANTARNSNTNGKSTSVVRLAEAMKSRTDSNDLKLAANDPTDTGRLSMRRSSTRSMICADNLTSTFLL